MSKTSCTTIICKNCGKEKIVTIYDSINVNLNFELKDKLLNGELTNIRCDCGQVTSLRYPMLYHKMGLGNSVMIHYTKLDIEEIRKQHEAVMQWFVNIFPKNSFQSNMKESLRKQGVEAEDIIEAYNDWDKFIERIKEIG